MQQAFRQFKANIFQALAHPTRIVIVQRIPFTLSHPLSLIPGAFAGQLDMLATRQAALLSLGPPRVGTAGLAGAFLWAHALTSSWTYTDWHLGGLPALGPGLLLRVGIGAKAGMGLFRLFPEEIRVQRCDGMHTSMRPRLGAAVALSGVSCGGQRNGAVALAYAWTGGEARHPWPLLHGIAPALGPLRACPTMAADRSLGRRSTTYEAG